ncbi:hypothetical protein ACOME3_010138 [Neoechinorhynchus agilis]
MIESIIKLLIDYNYLTDAQLIGLRKYKYNAIDNSPLSTYVMHPIWDFVVNYVPLWIAPNSMTFAGFGLLVLGYSILSYHDFHFDLPEHRYKFCRPIWLTMFFLQVLSHSLDCLDGKQARRTKSSSALGELFDHGLDSWACGLFPLPFLSVVSMVPPFGLSLIEFHFLLWFIYISFFISHWEKYNTGVLYLPWSYDLSMLLLALCYYLVFKYTPQLFQFTFPIIGLTFARAVLVTIAVSVIFLSIPVSISNVRRAFKNKTQIWSHKREVVRPFSSMAALFATSTFWAVKSHNSVPLNQPRLFFLATSTMFSSLVCRLIVAEMSFTQCKPFNLSLIPYLMTVLLSTLPILTPSMETYVLFIYTAYGIAAHAHYGTCVVRQIARHLNVRIFHITNAN